MKNLTALKVCICCFVFGAQLFTIFDSHAASDQPYVLKIGTMELPPYGWVDDEDKNHGIVFELNQEIGKRSGMQFTNEIMPFARMLFMLRSGRLDLISSQPHQKALEAGDKLEVVMKINVIAGTRKDAGIRNIDDFRDKVLVYHLGASYPVLDSLPRYIHRVNDYKLAVKMLHVRPWVDGAVFSEPAYYYWMRELGLSPDDFGEVIMIEPGREQWMFVRRNLPENIRKKLKRVVKEIYQENLYEKLLKKLKYKDANR